MVHVVTLSLDLEIHLFSKAQLVSFLINNTFIVVFSKYADFANIFSLRFTAKLSKHTKITNYLIDLVDDQQPFYEPIYSLEPIELENLKIYIETN